MRTDFDISGDQFDTLAGILPGGLVDREDLDHAVIGDIDRGTGLFGDGTDGGATLTDDVADLVRIDLEGDDARRMFGHLLARRSDRLVHLAQDIQPPALGLIQGDLHDLAGDAVDLDVHLQRVDASVCAGHLEVHVAEMILVTQDVGQHGEVDRLP